MVPDGASFLKECVFMNGKKGLSRIMSALLAASSMVGGASAAPAGKKDVREVKKVVDKIDGKRRNRHKNRGGDAGGRKRRDKAIDARDEAIDSHVPGPTPFGNFRNLVGAGLGLLTVGSGVMAFYYRNRASRDCRALMESWQMLSAISYSRGYISEFLECRDGKTLFAKGIVGKFGEKFYGYVDEKVDEGKGKVETGWKADLKYCCDVYDGKFYANPAVRSLRDDIGVFVDAMLVKVLLNKLSGHGLYLIDLGSNKGSDGTVTDLRKYLQNKLKTILAEKEKIGDLSDLRRDIGFAFRGAELLKECLRKKFSGFAADYKGEFFAI